MPIDLAVLATTVVSSFLYPYVKKGAEKIAEAVTEKFSSAAAEHVSGLATKVWERVQNVFSAPKDQQVLDLFKENPDDMQAMMKTILQEKLKDNDQLAQELNDLVQQPSPDGSGNGAQIMQTSGIAGIFDARNAQFSGSGGVFGGVVIGASPQPTPPPPASDPNKEK